ncbi:MAG: class I SAM-dependent methyltransferase [Desulfobacteraceae bacterium]|jgi:ubiquinone/menaquinone biosynthesis C-methylase UbiE
MEEDQAGVTLEVMERYVDLDGRDILEVGCGDGRITAPLTERAGRVVAVDPDAASVLQARIQAPKAEMAVGSGEDLGFSQCSFDVVVFTLSLHHHQDGHRALEEGFRVLRPGGRAIVLEPEEDGEVQRVCEVLLDERRALGRARQAIRESPFQCTARERFETLWEFEDSDEFRVWLFSYYGVPYDAAVADRANHILEGFGRDLSARPFVLSDRLRIDVLQKGP